MWILKAERKISHWSCFSGLCEINFIFKVGGGEDDFWYRKHNKNEDFSVKSAYWLATHINKGNIFQEAQMQPSLNCLKEKVWHLQAGPKIKSFLWRVLNEV